MSANIKAVAITVCVVFAAVPVFFWLVAWVKFCYSLVQGM